MFKPNVQKYIKAIVEQAKEQSRESVSNYQVNYSKSLDFTHF